MLITYLFDKHHFYKQHYFHIANLNLKKDKDVWETEYEGKLHFQQWKLIKQQQKIEFSSDFQKMKTVVKHFTVSDLRQGAAQKNSLHGNNVNKYLYWNTVKPVYSGHAI